MPEDDSSWTIIKGSNFGMDGIDTFAFSNVTSSRADMTFGLGADDSGKIYNFPMSLAVGAEDTSAYFEGLQNSYGGLRIKREL